MHLLTTAALLAAGAAVAPAVFPATPRAYPQTPSPSDEIPSTCPVTKPLEYPFVPPPPYPSARRFSIGTPKLWTNTPADGIWSGLPHYTPDDPRFRQKLFWWSEGYDWRAENPPHLTVTGERLDVPDSFITTDENVHAGWTNDRDHAFMVVGIFIPTVGCWKIKGRYNGAELSYVVWVTDSARSVDANKCSPNELLAVLKPDDPVYTDALNLARTLQIHGFVVKCVGQSTMIDVFRSQQGAALFKTDQGDFEALFLPNNDTFDSVESIESRENGRFLYSFLGNPSPKSPHPINSAYAMYFVKHANQFFITSDSELAATIAKAVN
jgi:hypothetical protein